MNEPAQPARAPLEQLIARPVVTVTEAEYRRLLGYPPHHTPGERADELAAWARRWYAEHGRPWITLREVDLRITENTVWLGGAEFSSPALHAHLRQGGATGAVLAAVSAGAECEEHARQLWQESKPDEYFFLEMFGSAVVEDLVASLNGRVCDLAGHDGLKALAHYSPGYSGWDVADQPRFFDLLTAGGTRPRPGPLAVLPSGMLRPKKSLLAVIGLTARDHPDDVRPNLVPCTSCSFSPCRYRRAAYRNAPVRIGANFAPVAGVVAAPPALTPAAHYVTSTRALRKWAQERVRLEPRPDGSVQATFRFDGTTCSNMGRPLAFDYLVTLSSPADGYAIRDADCRPAPGDDGHRFMCAYLSDGEALLATIASEKPLLGQPLNDVLAWQRADAPSGCHCRAESRLHKWGLALEAIHYALANRV